MRPRKALERFAFTNWLDGAISASLPSGDPSILPLLVEIVNSVCWVEFGNVKLFTLITPLARGSVNATIDSDVIDVVVFRAYRCCVNRMDNVMFDSVGSADVYFRVFTYLLLWMQA